MSIKSWIVFYFNFARRKNTPETLRPLSPFNFFYFIDYPIIMNLLFLSSLLMGSLLLFVPSVLSEYTKIMVHKNPSSLPLYSADFWTWTDAFDLSLGGRPFNIPRGQNNSYARLPPEASGDVPEWVWTWGQCSSGMFVQFTSNASTIALDYVLLNANYTQFSNFPPNGFSGMDLYRYDDGNQTWRWLATTFDGLGSRPNGGEVLESPLFTDSLGWPTGPIPSFLTLNSTYRYRIHLPSYNGVTSVKIGVPTGAYIAPDNSWQVPTKPVTYYGTSITQGGLTARPGNTYVARLSQKLNVPIYNLGFCGACRMELSVAKYLSQIDTSLFIIDCAWNMDPALIKNNTEPLVNYLRSVQPNIPILLVEPSDYRPSWIVGDGQFNNTGRRIELYAAYQRLLANGVKNLYYQNGSSLFTGDLPTEDPTFEGTHPLDHGHLLIANVLQPVIGGILGLDRMPLLDHNIHPSPPSTDDLIIQSSKGTTPSTTMARYPRTTIPLSYETINDSSNVTKVSSDNFLGTLNWAPASSLFMRGRAFNDTPTIFNRLPSAAHGVVRDAVWGLSLNSAGILVGFATTSTSISVNYTASDAFYPMVHFPVSGVSGMELFSLDESTGTWRHVQPLQLDYTVNFYSNLVIGNILPTSDGKPRSYILHLPTYNTADNIWIGVDSNAAITPSDPFATSTHGPIVWYGTSILQGGVSFKSANIFTSVISRALNTEIFNFGFSGNGEMEISVAQFLTLIPNPSVFIVDCVHNMDAPQITQNAVPLVQYYRQNHPTTPIIFVEGTMVGMDWGVPDSMANTVAQGEALYAAYQQLVNAGDKNMYYVKSSDLFTPSSVLDSPTSRGLHPSDEGNHNMANFYIQYLSNLLNNQK